MFYYRNFMMNRMTAEMDYLNQCGPPIRYEDDPVDPPENRRTEQEKELKESDQKKRP